MAVSPGLGSLSCGSVAVLNTCRNCPVAAHRLAICVEFLDLALCNPVLQSGLPCGIVHGGELGCHEAPGNAFLPIFAILLLMPLYK